MARLYLSLLGTSPYNSCRYRIDEFVKDTRFVQVATAEYSCKDWGEADRIVVLLTEEAEEKNWRDNADVTEDARSNHGLETELRALELLPKIESRRIPVGASDAELWQIFSVLFDTLDERDEIVFDITHALRYLPMLAIVVANYGKVCKNVSMKKIYYGSFETGQRTSEGSLREVQVLELSQFNTLLEWSHAVDRFIAAGDSGLIKKMADSSTQPLGKESKGKDQLARDVQSLAGALDCFTLSAKTCRGKEISKIAQKLRDRVTSCEGHPEIAAFGPLLSKLKEEVRHFSDDSTTNGVRAAQWCLEHNMVQQGVTILQEALVNMLANEAGLDPSERSTREICSSAFNIANKEIPAESWRGASGKDPELTRQVLDKLRDQKALREVYCNLSDLRNDLNHAGWRSNSRSAKKITEQAELLLNQTLSIVSSERL